MCSPTVIFWITIPPKENYNTKENKVKETIDISKYSGRCDCYDILIMIHKYTLEELQNNVDIYIGKNTESLKIDSMTDLIPYYPHIITSAAFNNATRYAAISLSLESWVDIEERQSLEFFKKELVKRYNRCQRKKMEFVPEMAVNDMNLLSNNSEIIIELGRRVKENGSMASIDGLHLSMHELYRQELVDEMIDNGLNPIDYGYGRFIND